jgi:hypothetical protein
VVTGQRLHEIQINGVTMRVRCESNDASRLTAERFHGVTPASQFDLFAGQEYVVCGIMLSGSLLSYLIIGEGKFPHWYPAEVFSVNRSDLPPQLALRSVQ